MTNEERDIISQFIARVGGGGQQASFGSGSVPAPQQQALPPIDRDADTYIGQMFNQYPEARYRITQLAFVQERALIEAQNRIKRLEWEVQQAQQAAQAAQQQPQQRSGGGLFGGLFGGGNRQQSGPPPGGPWNQGRPQQQYYQSAPPPPQYPPNYQPGMLPRQGSGFLGSALTTAAGVAGGLVVGNALMDLFSPHHSGLGGLAGGAVPGASPWATPAPDQGYTDTGGWDQSGGGAANQDYVDNGGWDQGSNNNDAGGWDSGSSDGGGWDSSSGDGGGNTDDTY